MTQDMESLSPSDDPGYSVTGAELVETDRDGLLRYRLNADRIVQNPSSLRIDVENPILGLHERGSPAWTISADRGELPGDARSIVLVGDVHVSSSRNPDQPDLQLTTTSLNYDFTSGLARTDAVVSLMVDGHSLQGSGLEADLRRRQARLKDSVQGRFEP